MGGARGRLLRCRGPSVSRSRWGFQGGHSCEHSPSRAPGCASVVPNVKPHRPWNQASLGLNRGLTLLCSRTALGLGSHLGSGVAAVPSPDAVVRINADQAWRPDCPAELRKRRCSSSCSVVHSLQVVRLVCPGLAPCPPVSHSSPSHGLVASCFTHASNTRSQEVARLQAFFSVQALVAVVYGA